MQKYRDSVQRSSGQAIAAATVTVTTYPGGAAATLYSDNGSTQYPSNVLETDATGEFSFYAANGHYTVAIVTQYGNQTNTDVVLFDPSDGTNQTITLTGDVTGSGTSSFAATIGSNKVVTAKILDANVTLAKMANIATQTILGRTTASTGVPEALTALQAAGVVQGDGSDVDLCGFRGIPQVSFSANTTLAASHNGKELFHPSSDANARTLTIDSNANLALEIGFTFSGTNDSANAVTIAITSDTLVWAPTGATGSRTLAQYGTFTARKVASTRWYLTGVGLT